MCVKKNVRYNTRMTDKQIIGYGMTAELIDQLGPEPAAAVARVRASGLDGVFLKVLDPVTVAACKDAGLAVYASQAVFLADDELWARFPRSRPLTPRSRECSASRSGWPGLVIPPSYSKLPNPVQPSSTIGTDPPASTHRPL